MASSAANESLAAAAESGTDATAATASSIAGEHRIKEVMVDSRINKVLAMRTDSVAMLEALDAISEFYVTNTADARRMLRQDLEFQNISLAKKFLGEFDKVKQRLEAVEKLSGSLQHECGLLASRVKDADENMKSFMEKASHLENKRNHYQAQSVEIDSFLSKFHLSSEEIQLLSYANMDLAESANSFFDTLQRLQRAYGDCKEMVEKHCYSVGFELLEVLGQHQETAFQHLFDWVKSKCDALAAVGSSNAAASSAVDDFETNTKLQISIRFLKEVPIYFDQCQDLLINSRRTQLVQRFIVALTQGDSTATGSAQAATRALDLQAHDAPRYVGGMLAWMHQAVASELEFLESIFGEQSKVTSRNSAQRKAEEDSSSVGEWKIATGEDDEDGTPAPRRQTGLSIPELLSRCLQGLGRPLRVRIIQTLETKSNIEILYPLTDLLSFYEETFRRIIPLENAVHSAVKGCLKECKRMFLTALNKQAESLTQSPISYPLDLKASHVTRECALQVKEILRVYSGALSATATDVSDECHVDQVLGNIIQPLLQSCRLGGQSLQSAEMAIFMLNNVSILQHEIREASKRSRHSYRSSSWLSLLEQEASTWIEILVKEEVAKTLKRSDMDKLLELIEVLPAGLRAADQVGLGNDRVGTVVRAFYASLFSTVSAQFERLQDPSLKEIIRNSTAEKVAAAHAKIHLFVSEKENGYDSTVLAHSVEEVRVLLGCPSKA